MKRFVGGDDELARRSELNQLRVKILPDAVMRYHEVCMDTASWMLTSLDYAMLRLGEDPRLCLPHPTSRWKLCHLLWRLSIGLARQRSWRRWRQPRHQSVLRTSCIDDSCSRGRDCCSSIPAQSFVLLLEGVYQQSLGRTEMVETTT